MNRLTEQKIILITQKTRLENLITRYNTAGQAKFYVESHGGSFDDYILEDKLYRAAVKKTVDFAETYGRLQVIDRDFIPNFIFGENDLVIVVGRDGLVVNTLKYLNKQKLIGINPDPDRWDGVLLPFRADEKTKIIPETVNNIRQVKSVTFAQAKLNDGQSLIGVGDIFIGQKTHVSARYELSIGNLKETQSSSGIIVSTGLGATGWLKSILAGAEGINRYYKGNSRLETESNFKCDSRCLYYSVREPYPSNSTGTQIVFGKIKEREKLSITSYMPENGVIFSDGMEQDFLEFNSGTKAEIGVCQKCGNLVV